MKGAPSATEERCSAAKGVFRPLAAGLLGLVLLWCAALAADTGKGEIQTIAAAHRKWLKALGDPALLDAMGMESGFIAESMMRDPRRARLNGQDYSGLDFPGIVLRAAELKAVRLTNAALSRADLSHARLQGAELAGANLERADLRYANLQNGKLAGATLAGADLRNANLNGADLRGATLTEADLRQSHLAGADLRGANLSEANLSEADLTQAVLVSADLQNARLRGAQLIDSDLRGAGLKMTDLTGALLSGANMNEAFLFDTNLADVTLNGASLRGINLFANNLNGTNLDGVNLMGVVFDPSAERARELGEKLETISRAKNLGLMTFYNDPGPLEHLRRLFKEEGYQKQELEITYAIRRGERKRISESGTFWERLASMAAFVFIEFPIEYGASPYRPFGIIFALVGLCGLIYVIPLKWPSQRFGEIWMITPKGRFFGADDAVREEVVRLRRPRDLVLAFWFSFLSTFNIGGKIFNLDDLFMQCQPREYHLRGTMWVRTIAGIQSLICIYLVVLVLLVYLEKITF
jgi:uncharacterized protein YjbI with pentapeptide repeats